MSPFTHPIPAEWLTAYYDGELEGAQQDQMEAHLRQCAECRHELEQWNALSQTLASDQSSQVALTGQSAFWRRVQSQLPERRPARPAPAPLRARSVLLRWSPGIGLLLLNAGVQVAAVAGTALMLVPARLWIVPDWASWGYGLAANAGLGWLAWLVPGSWSGLGLIVSLLTLSGGLAVLYLAWLGYELRYGASAQSARVIAERGI
jgi:anti-sigma factor RsiW